MRETRTSGSEGGGTDWSSLPLSLPATSLGSLGTLQAISNVAVRLRGLDAPYITG